MLARSITDREVTKMSEEFRAVPGMVIPEDLEKDSPKREWMERQLAPAKKIMQTKPYTRKTLECMSCNRLIACKGKPITVDRCVSYEERKK